MTVVFLLLFIMRLLWLTSTSMVILKNHLQHSVYGNWHISEYSVEYFVYTEDNEESLALVRKQFLKFLNPCEWVGVENNITMEIEERRVSCIDDEVVRIFGEDYLHSYCLGWNRTDGSISSSTADRAAPISFLRRLSFFETNCSCQVKCYTDGGWVEFIRFAGCKCHRDEIENKGQHCFDKRCVWSIDNSVGNPTWSLVNGSSGTHWHGGLVSVTIPASLTHAVSLVSPYFQHIGMECTMAFAYKLSSERHSSIVVYTETLGLSKNDTIMEEREEHIYNEDLNQPFVLREEKDKYNLRHLTSLVQLGRFFLPTRIRIECRSDGGGEVDTFCNIGSIEWKHGCDLKDLTAPSCRSDSFICELPGHLSCFDDVMCDMTIDCPNKLDEANCGQQPNGSRCDFEDEYTLCPHWKIQTMADKMINDHLLIRTNASITTIVSKDESLGTTQLGPIHEARPGSGHFLLYSVERLQNLHYTRRSTFFTSPFFPPILSRKRNQCKLRFMMIQSTFDEVLSINIGYPGWVEGRKTKKIWASSDRASQLQQAAMYWRRISITLPRQVFPFYISFYAEWNEHISQQKGYIAFDDISFSKECFKDGEPLFPAKNWTSLNISSCGVTGSRLIEEEDCTNTYKSGNYHYWDIQSQSDRCQQLCLTQVWDVPKTMPYRILACGAAGGSLPSEETNNYGGCITVDFHLVTGQRMETIIGQKGESPCDGWELKSMTVEQTLAFDRICNQQTTEVGVDIDHIPGTGGGGATVVYLSGEITPVIVAGGGGGIFPTDFLEGIPVNAVGGADEWQRKKLVEMAEKKGVQVAGFGGSNVQNTYHGCESACVLASAEELHSSTACPPMYPFRSLGGRGGGAASCGAGGGGGGGYHGGVPSLRNHGSGGTSYLRWEVDHLKTVGENGGDGFVRIYPCHLQCPSNATCVFASLHSVDKQLCRCIYGELIENHQKCSEYKVISLLLQRKQLVLTLVLLLVTCTPMAFWSCFWFRSKKFNSTADQIKLVVMQSDYGDVDMREDYWGQIAALPQLPWDGIHIGVQIGTGAFGTVNKATMNDGTEVAVKTICMNNSTSTEAQREFAFEALFMHKFNHENIVRLHFVQWDPPRLRIVLEMMSGGDLLSFLREARPNLENPNPYALEIIDLVKISMDVAKGCEELDRQKYIHRDLAARNCLLTEKGRNRIVKIGDFGLARDIYENNYYRKGGRAKLPVKWMPPEAFLDGLFTTQTDVWSFGVVCWEIFSFGLQPYFGLDNLDVMELVTRGGRLEPPRAIPPQMHQLMLNCWCTVSSDRPSFTSIVQTLHAIHQDPLLIGCPISPPLTSCSTLNSPLTPSPLSSFLVQTPSAVQTPCTVLTALSSSTTPEGSNSRGFGISMSGVPYTPITAGALRDVLEMPEMIEKDCSDSQKLLLFPKYFGHLAQNKRGTLSVSPDSNHSYSSGHYSTLTRMRQALFGNKVPPTPPPRRPNTLPTFQNTCV